MTRGCWQCRRPRVGCGVAGKPFPWVTHPTDQRAGIIARRIPTTSLHNMTPSCLRAIRRSAFILRVLLAAAVAGAAAPAAAQAQEAAADRTTDAANVFLDCSYRCDQDFLRTEITYVNWVRDRTVADVHLLVTTQSTGGGGTEFTLAFLGQRRFTGLSDTLRYVAPPTNTADNTRRELRRTMALGLVRFVARTDAGARLTIAGVAPAPGAAAEQASPARDPWNYWTFRVNANTNFGGERSYERRYYYMAANASRITEQWKITVSANQSQNTSRFIFEDPNGGRTAFTSFTRNLGLSNLVVKSLTPHWSAGVRSGITSSTYYNQTANMSVLPTVEYNIFPYSESTRRQLRLQYGVGGRSLRYRDSTIYGRLKETKPQHTAAIALDLRQPWGSASLNTDAQQYLDEPRYYRWSSFASANVRVFKGLSVNFHGGYDLLRDQIYISAKGASRDEILTRQRQLATGFNYFGGIGLTYTFGSIYNNVVNPRFGGSGGGSFIVF